MEKQKQKGDFALTKEKKGDSENQRRKKGDSENSVHSVFRGGKVRRGFLLGGGCVTQGRIEMLKKSSDPRKAARTASPPACAVLSKKKSLSAEWMRVLYCRERES